MKAGTGAVQEGPTAPKQWYEDITLLVKFPWVKFKLDTEAKGAQPDKDSDGSSDSGKSTDQAGEERKAMLEEEADVVFSALEKKRREWQLLIPSERPHFKVRVPGGAWTQEFYEVPFKEGLARHVGAAVKEWCKRFRTGEQKSYAWARYGESRAMQLCHYWADIMEYYYSLSVESGQGLGYRYTDTDFQDAPRPPAEL
eukprot:10854975-Lingulodinium_polyedra.AAC.1